MKTATFYSCPSLSFATNDAWNRRRRGQGLRPGIAATGANWEGKGDNNSTLSATVKWAGKGDNNSTRRAAGSQGGKRALLPRPPQVPLPFPSQDPDILLKVHKTSCATGCSSRTTSAKGRRQWPPMRRLICACKSLIKALCDLLHTPEIVRKC